MSIIDEVKSCFKHSQLFNFNVINRDRWIAHQAAKLPAGSRILDAGAGSCPYRGCFSHCDYKAQDFATLKGEQLSGGEYGQIDYVCDITSIPVPDESFDAILCSEVLEHLPEPIRAIEEFARILKPGGTMIITAPLGSGLHQEPFHFYGGYTPFWYEKFLAEAGFEAICVEENGRSLRACAQESMRFIQLSRPFRLGMPLLMELIWLPFWLMVVPVMALLAPVAGFLLNRYDTDKRFTIGYHVTAIKAHVA